MSKLDLLRVCRLGLLATCVSMSAMAADPEDPQPVQVKLGGEVDLYQAQRRVELGVSGFLGLAQFEIPLPLPSSGGLAPELSLGYVSSRRIGLCGLGCDVRIPSIRKSNKAPVSPDDSGLVYSTGSGSTRLLRSGAALFLESSSQPVRIRAADGGFVLEDGSGGRTYFGVTADSVQAGPDLQPFLWRLSRRENAFSNVVRYTWSGEKLGRIAWGTAPMGFEVSFHWKATGFIHQDHVSRERFDAVLERVELVRGADSVGTFNLSYHDSDPERPWPLLKEVSQQSADISQKIASLEFAQEPAIRLQQQYAEQLAVADLSDSRIRVAKSPRTGKSHLILISKVDGKGQIQLMFWRDGTVRWSNLGFFGDGDASNYKFADVDGDGAEDLVFVSPTQTVLVAFVDYENAALRQASYGSIPFTAYKEPIDKKSYYNIVFQSGRYWMADITGDGRPEMFFVDHHGNVSQSALAIDKGTYAFSNPVALGEGEQLSRYMFTDVNGDGRNDLVLATRDGQLLAAFSDGTKLGPVQKLAGGLPSASSADFRLLATDYNSDGLVDFIFPEPNQAQVYINDPGAILPAPLQVRSATGLTPQGNRLTPANVNGDSYVDLVQSDVDGLYVLVAGQAGYVRRGISLSANPSFDSLAWPDKLKIMRLADLNGDGRPDLVLVDSTNTLRVFIAPANQHSILSDGLLERLYNGLGGMTEIRYGSSTNFMQAALPLGLALVERTRTRASGKAMPAEPDSAWTRYEYEGGYVHAATSEFRGFGKVREFSPTSAEGHVVLRETLFHQGDGDGSSPGDVNTAKARYSGLPYLRTTTSEKWTLEESFKYRPPVSIPFLRRETLRKSVKCLASLSGKDCASLEERMDYDDFGNLLLKVQADPAIPLATKIQSSTFAADTATWVLNRMTSSALSQAATSTQLEASEHSYQPSPDCPNALASPSPRPTTVRRWVKENVYVTDSFGYDVFGNITCRKSGANTETKVFDSSGTVLLSTRNKLGHSETYEYYGQKQKSVGFKVGLLAKSTDANGVSTTRDYDSLGRPVYISREGCADMSAGCARYLISYLDWGAPGVQRVRVIEDGKTVNESKLDGEGREVFLSRSVAFGDIVRQERVFDDEGLLRRLSAPYLATQGGAAHWFEVTYDPMRRRSSLKWPDGTTQVKCYHPNHQTIIDPKGKMLRVWIDGFGRNVRAEDFDLVATGCVTGQPVRYSAVDFSYDALDRIVGYERNLGFKGSRTYNGLSKLVDSDDPDTGATSFTYDVYGRLSLRKNAEGSAIEFKYDDLNRVTTETLRDVNGKVEDEYLNTYDAATQFVIGRLASTKSRAGTYGFTYNVLGKVAEETLKISNAKYTTQYRYDNLGRTTQTVTPDGQTISYLYAGPRLVDISRNGVSLASASRLTPWGQPSSMILGNGLSVQSYYGITDARCGAATFRLCEVRVTETEGGARVLGSRGYTFDTRGSVATAQLDALTRETYAYDNLARLAQVTISGAPNSGSEVVAFDYDELHRMVRHGGLGQFTHGDSSGPAFLPKRIADERLIFDRAGNMLDSGLATMTYNARGEMVSVKDRSSGSLSTMVRDSAGNVVLRRRNGVTTVRPNSKTECRSPTRCNVYVDWEGAPVAMVQKGKSPIFLHGDIFNTVWLATTAKGEVATTYRALPFGGRLASTEVGNNVHPRRSSFGKDEIPIRTSANGSERGTAQLLDFGFRIYEARLAMFAQADVLPLPLMDPRFANRYSYGVQNPMLYADPSGAMSASEYVRDGMICLCMGAVQGIMLYEGGALIPGVNMALATGMTKNFTQAALNFQTAATGDSIALDTFSSATDPVGQIASALHMIASGGDFRSSMKFGASASDLASLRNVLEHPDKIIDMVRSGRATLESAKSFVEYSEKVYKAAGAGEGAKTILNGLQRVERELEKMKGSSKQEIDRGSMGGRGPATKGDDGGSSRGSGGGGSCRTCQRAMPDG